MIFEKYRKTEATSLFVFKSLVSILLLISVLVYTWIIVWGIYNDNPVVQISLKEENYIPVPGVTFETYVPAPTLGDDSEPLDQKISCHFVNASGIQDCNQYIRYSFNNKNGKNSTKGRFATRYLMFFAVPNNGISSLEFKVYLNDTSHNISGGFLSPYMFFGMTDADFASSKYLNSYPFQNQLSTYSKFIYTVISLNQYTLALFNVLNSLGLIGGAWGFAATIYAILFGTNAIKPWGLTQKYGFKINNSVQTKLKNTLEFIPFVNHPKTTNNLNNHELKRRLDSLQLFLTEYVVNVQYLEKIYKANINGK
ncbi:36902_t:CDS:2, partial [Gigaspora margarita]